MSVSEVAAASEVDDSTCIDGREMCRWVRFLGKARLAPPNEAAESVGNDATRREGMARAKVLATIIADWSPSWLVSWSDVLCYALRLLCQPKIYGLAVYPSEFCGPKSHNDNEDSYVARNSYSHNESM